MFRNFGPHFYDLLESKFQDGFMCILQYKKIFKFFRLIYVILNKARNPNLVLKSTFSIAKNLENMKLIFAYCKEAF
jgi:hypothetical protein